jgi:hypothetical protein
MAPQGYTLAPVNAPVYGMAPGPQAAPVAEYAEDPRENAVAAFAPAPALPRAVLRTPRNALTNEGLVTLATVGYDEDFILDLMRMKNCRFDTSVEGLAYMATHGLTERIIRAALDAEAARQNPLAASAR